MERVSVRDLHIRTSEMVKAASEGAVIVIERRGEPVAELRPITPARTKPKLPNMSRYWTKFPRVQADSGRYLEEDR